MTRKEITAALSALTEKHINPYHDPRIYWAREVTFDYETDHTVRVDYMRFKPQNNTTSGIEKGDFFCYEIKSSVEDFHSPNGHNFIGDYNYYVMPKEVYAAVEKEIPWNLGVLVPDDSWRILTSVSKAHRCSRERSVSLMLLMMYRSFARDVRKNEKREI